MPNGESILYTPIGCKLDEGAFAKGELTSANEGYGPPTSPSPQRLRLGNHSFHH